MDDRVRFALEKLLNIAHDDTGQGRRVANLLLAWWNAEALGGFDIADLFAVDREVSEDMATMFTYLAREEDAVYPTVYRGEIEKHHQTLAAGEGLRKDAVMPPLLGTGGRPMPLGAREFDEAALHRGKQRRRQRPEIAVVAVDRPNVRSRPSKTIAFGKHDPGALVIEPEPALGRGRDLDRFVGADRRRMADRQDAHDRRAVLERGDQRQHEARPVLVTLFAAFEMLPVPEIGIAEDVADLDFSRQHSCPSAVRR